MVRCSLLLGLIVLAASQPVPPPDFYRIGTAADLQGSGIPQGGTLYLPSETSVAFNAIAAAITTPAGVQIQITGNNIPPVAPTFGFTLGLVEAGRTGQNQPCRPFPTTQLVVPPPPIQLNYDQVQYQRALSQIPNPNIFGLAQSTQFTIPGQNAQPGGERWISQKLEIAGVPVQLCYSVTVGQNNEQWFTTGFNVAVAWDCIAGSPTQDCSQYELTTQVGAGYESLSLQQRLGLRAATQCCKSATGLQTGVCINPNVQRCCGGQPFNGQTQTCCNAAQQKVTRLGTSCTCAGSSSGTFIQNDPAFRIWQPQDVVCPAGQRCCLPSKYPEMTNSYYRGECYDPTVRRCCDTGAAYDPGTAQCCVINGLQSLDLPCPCSQNAHCTGSQLEFKSTTGRCCMQTDPAPRETQSQNCNIYANAPTVVNAANRGNGLAVNQRCIGNCIDIRYQICCNGVSCIQEYERCCNATCCNKFSATCDFGERTNTPLNMWNNNNFRVIFQHCSTIEQLNPPRAVLIFILPLFLMLLTLFSFAVAIVFANKATTRSYSGLEIAMIFTAVGAAVFAISLYFSPMWKYGLWIVLIAILSFLAAAARVFAFNAIVLLLQLIALFYIFDPFHASRYLNFSTTRDPSTGLPLPCTYGLFHTTQCMADEGSRNCRSYYDYFGYDPVLRDTDRFENPQVQAWGYCDRHWFTTLLIFEVVMMVFLIVLFFLTLLGLLLRFRSLIPEPIQLEIVKEQPEVIYPVQPYPVVVM